MHISSSKFVEINISFSYYIGLVKQNKLLSQTVLNQLTIERKICFMVDKCVLYKTKIYKK